MVTARCRRGCRTRRVARRRPRRPRARARAGAGAWSSSALGTDARGARVRGTRATRPYRPPGEGGAHAPPVGARANNQATRSPMGSGLFGCCPTNNHTAPAVARGCGANSPPRRVRRRVRGWSPSHASRASQHTHIMGAYPNLVVPIQQAPSDRPRPRPSARPELVPRVHYSHTHGSVAALALCATDAAAAALHPIADPWQLRCRVAVAVQCRQDYTFMGGRRV